MKTLITSTAIALITAAPLAAQSQDGTQTGTETSQSQASTGSPYRESMQQGDLRASDLMDAEIYAPSASDAANEVEETNGTVAGQTGSRWGQSMRAEDLQSMESIGSANDLVIDEEGRILAVIVDVGGFLGIGARNVALDLSQVNFVSDERDPSQIYIVSMVDVDTLETAPEFDDSTQRDMAASGEGNMATTGQNQTMASQTGDGMGWRGDRTVMTPPPTVREGYSETEASEMSAETMIGANVYDANDEDVGNIDDVVLGEDGQVQYAVVDVGGFLGLGTHTVAIGFDEMTVMQNENMSDLRVYVDVTQESLESMPEYEGR